MKINISIILLSFLILISTFSCTEQTSVLEGTYIREVPSKNPDSLFIKQIKDNLFQIETRYIKKGKKKSKSSTSTLNNGKLYFENGNNLIVTENNEILVGKHKYIKVD